MKIYGIGTDIVKVSRIKKSINKKNFIKRLFNKIEVKKCNNKAQKANCYAKRFAAKEAFSKALGSGISDGISFDEIVIDNDKKGKPFIRLLGKTKKIVSKKIKSNKYNIFLSLTDDSPFSAATVVISV